MEDPDLFNLTMTHYFTSDEKLQYFGYGEWVEEPDVITFFYKDIFCEIIRPSIFQERMPGCIMGYYCGYIYLHPHHPWVDYEDFFDINTNVHQGISHASYTTTGFLKVGFDCCHFCDINPGLPVLIFCPDLPRTYKNMNFCIKQCKILVNESIEAAKETNGQANS